MKLAVKHTKSKQIYDAISRQIAEGRLKPGDRIQPFRDICNYFSVSLSVVQAALGKLEQDGLVETEQGNGTFVKTSKLQNSSSGKNIFLSIPESGHVYGDLTQHIRNMLIKRGFIPISVDYKQMVAMEPDSVFRRNIDEILKSGIKAVIAFGDSYWRYPFLEKYKTLRSVFLCYMDYADAIPDRAVLLDQEKAIYLTTAHLAATGRKKIMLCTFKPDRRSLSPETLTRHHSTQFINGYERALKEYDIESYRKISYHTEIELNETFLKHLWDSPDRPDGIVCDQDFVALQFINAAFKLGIKIPEELSLTGLYDTPWCELAPVKITSVKFDWAALAKIAVDMTLEENPEKKIAHIKPELIVRESSCK